MHTLFSREFRLKEKLLIYGESQSIFAQICQSACANQADVLAPEAGFLGHVITVEQSVENVSSQ